MKKQKSAFTLFYQEKYNDISSDLDKNSKCTLLSERWSKLSDCEKKIYLDRSYIERCKYEND